MMDVSGFRLRWTPTDGTLELEEIATRRVKPASITELMDKGEGMGYLLDMALKHPFAWCSMEKERDNGNETTSSRAMQRLPILP